MTSNKSKPSRAVVAQNLRAFRRQAKLTQAELAREAGLSRATVAAIELGRYGSVELSSLDALAQALRRPPAVFLADYTTKSAPLGDTGKALLQAFIASKWGQLSEPSPEERHWLATLPETFWCGRPPSPRALFELLEVRRHHLT